MHGHNREVSIEQVRLGLFCVHCRWDEPTISMTSPQNLSGNKLTLENKRERFGSAISRNPSNLGNSLGSRRTNTSTSSKQISHVSPGLVKTELANPFLDFSFEETRHRQNQSLPLYGASTAVPPSFNFMNIQTSTTSVFNFGKEWNMSDQQQQTSSFTGKHQANSCVSSSGDTNSQSSVVQSIQFASTPGNTALGISNNACNQPNAKKDTFEYVADFTVNQQPYTLKALFTTSSSNVTCSLNLRQIGTESRLFSEVDKMNDGSIHGNETAVNDDVQLPSAIWVTVEKSEKKNHALKLSNTDNSWVSDHFNGSFAAGPFVAIRPLTCSVWIEFETFTMGEKQTLKHLTDLYVKQIHCDVRFSLKGDQHIGGHRNILAARSPVFAAMFQHNMKEAITGQVNIEDSEPDIFKHLLHYIYSGKMLTPLTDAIAQPLFLVADKYNIQGLKEECATFLLTCVRMDNVVGLLVWAHLHSMDALKEAALSFMAPNAKDICLLKDWEELTKNYADICLLAMRRMMGCT